MPTAASATFGAAMVAPLKYDGGSPGVMEAINLKISSTYAAGALVGEVTATPGVYATYATGNSDGSQLPSHILPYACKTDSSGNITLGDGTAGNEWGQKLTSISAWVPSRNVWNSADLPNLDSGAVTALKGLLLQGSVSAGKVIL